MLVRTYVSNFTCLIIYLPRLLSYSLHVTQAMEGKARARLFRTHARSTVHNTYPTTIREKLFYNIVQWT